MQGLPENVYECEYERVLSVALLAGACKIGEATAMDAWNEIHHIK